MILPLGQSNTPKGRLSEIVMAATSAPRVDSSNKNQLRAWDGDEGAYWADHADYFDRSVAAYHRRLLDQAAIDTGDHVLDVGCGTGQTTRDAARAASAGSALGVDVSSQFSEAGSPVLSRSGLPVSVTLLHESESSAAPSNDFLMALRPLFPVPSAEIAES